MPSFADDDWFRGLVCSLAALGMILIGYTGYYGFLEKRWPDYNVYYDDDDEDEIEKSIPDAISNQAYDEVDETSQDSTEL